MSIWKSFAKIWFVFKCKFKANFLTFWFKKKPNQLWREIWIQVLVILLLYYFHFFQIREGWAAPLAPLGSDGPVIIYEPTPCEHEQNKCQSLVTSLI